MIESAVSRLNAEDTGRNPQTLTAGLLFRSCKHRDGAAVAVLNRNDAGGSLLSPRPFRPSYLRVGVPGNAHGRLPDQVHQCPPPGILLVGILEPAPDGIVLEGEALHVLG